MTRHVIITLHGMSKGSIAISLCRYNLVQGCFHVSSYIRIGILVNCQGCGRVLDKKVAHANVNLLDIFPRNLDNVASDQVTAS
jgi:hypothetical protein